MLRSVQIFQPGDGPPEIRAELAVLQAAAHDHAAAIVRRKSASADRFDEQVGLDAMATVADAAPVVVAQVLEQLASLVVCLAAVSAELGPDGATTAEFLEVALRAVAPPAI